MPTEPGDVLPSVHPEQLRQVKVQQLFIRFALGATVSVFAGIIAKAVGARIGGLFLAFPAILPASLTIVQDEEGTRAAARDAIGAVLGAAALVCFAAVGEALFTKVNSALVLLAAFAAWVAAAGILYSVVALCRPDDCDKSKD